MSDIKTIPTWFWVVSGLALVWNLMGVGAFFSDVVLMTPERLAAMDQTMADTYRDTPIWAKAAFGVAVLAGTLGSIGLLLKKSWATPIFAISLLGVIVQMTYAFVLSNSYEAFGPEAAAMPIMIFTVAVLLVWFAHAMTKSGRLS